MSHILNTDNTLTQKMSLAALGLPPLGIHSGTKLDGSKRKKTPRPHMGPLDITKLATKNAALKSAGSSPRDLSFGSNLSDLTKDTPRGADDTPEIILRHNSESDCLVDDPHNNLSSLICVSEDKQSSCGNSRQSSYDFETISSLTSASLSTVRSLINIKRSKTIKMISQEMLCDPEATDVIELPPSGERRSLLGAMTSPNDVEIQSLL